MKALRRALMFHLKSVVNGRAALVRPAFSLVLLLVTACPSVVVAAGEKPDKTGNDTDDSRPQKLIGPETYAPDKQVIVPRDPYGFRKKGSLISKAHHRTVTYDDDQLRQKRLSLYGQSDRDRPIDQPVERKSRKKVVTEPPVKTANWILLGFGVTAALTGGITFVLSRRKPQPTKPTNTVPQSSMRRVGPQFSKKKTRGDGLRSPSQGGLRTP